MRRTAAALSWAAAIYLLLRSVAFYFEWGGTRRHHLESASFAFVLLLFPLILRRPGTVDADGREPDPSRPVGLAFTSLAFVAGSVALCWPLLSTGLFADDYVIADAAREGRLTAWRELFRPVIFLVWRPLIAAVAWPGVLLHTLNVVLHGVNAALVAALAQGLFRRRSSAVIAGALFLCIPAGFEAVAWPSGLQDVLMTTFVLTFLVLAGADRQPGRSTVMALVALVAGLLTKETAIAAPLLAALLATARDRGEARRRSWTIAALSLIVVAAFVAIRLAVLPLPDSYGASLTRYGIKELIVRPFATLVVPLRETETQWAPLAAIGLAALVVVALRMAAGRWDRAAPAFRIGVIGAVFVLAAVAPVLSYFYVDPDLLGSRYLYLAQAGWTFVLVAILDTAGRGRRVVVVPIVMLLLLSWIVAVRAHMNLWVEAAQTRDKILAAAGATRPDCHAWAVYGLPATIRGVPVFINGFPEAARDELVGNIRVAPSAPDPGECRLTWNGERFVRD